MRGKLISLTFIIMASFTIACKNQFAGIFKNNSKNIVSTIQIQSPIDTNNEKYKIKDSRLSLKRFIKI